MFIYDFILDKWRKVGKCAVGKKCLFLHNTSTIKQESVERHGFGDYQYMITIQKKRYKGDNTKTGKKHFCRWDNEDHAHGTWLHFKSSSIWGGFDDEIMVWTISTRSVVCYPSHLLFFISMQKREGLKLQRIRIPASSRSIVDNKKHQTQRKMIFCLALNKHWSE